MNRRGLLGGMLAGLAAPAIIRTPGLLMPVRMAFQGNGFQTVPSYPIYDLATGLLTPAWPRFYFELWERIGSLEPPGIGISS